MKFAEVFRPAQELAALTSLRLTPGEQILEAHGGASTVHFQTLKERAEHGADQADVHLLLIPARNEQEDLPGTLYAAQRAGNVLPIVLNNQSHDATPDIAESMGAVLLDVPRGGIVAAVQKGIQHARESFGASTVFFTDADTLIPSNWATAMHRRIDQVDRGQGAAVYGNGLLWYGANKRTDVALSVGKAARHALFSLRTEQGKPAYGYNQALRLDAEGKIESAIAELDPRISTGADGEMKDAIRRAGGRVAYAHGLETWVVPRNDRISSVRQRLSRAYQQQRVAAYQAQYASAL